MMAIIAPRNLGIRTRLALISIVSGFFFICLSFPLTTFLTSKEVQKRESSRLTLSRIGFENLKNSFTLKSGVITKKNLKTFLDYSLTNSFPDDDTYFLGIIDGKLYKTSPSPLPPNLNIDGQLLLDLSSSTEKAKGIVTTNDPKIGSILYKSLPIKEGDTTIGYFSIVITTAGETIEATEAIRIVRKWFIFLFFLTIIMSWFASSRVTDPLKDLVKAMDGVSETNLSDRLSVKGTDELSVVAQKYNQMLNRLEGAITSYKEFIRDISHELRTPITVIRGHFELAQMQSEALDLCTIELLLNETDRMSRLIEEISSLARSDRPEFLVKESFELQPFLKSVLRNASTLASRKWCLQTANDCTVVADRDRLTQCLMNLLVNASQHTVEGDLITLGGHAESDRTLKLWVQDQGHGIEPLLKRRVFERFSRGSNTRRDQIGSGLGLAIVQSIVKAHGGTVDVVSELGEGATFTIFLPNAVQPPPRITPNTLGSHQNAKSMS